MAGRAPLKLVVFDCDGTLVDSQHNIIHAMTAAFEACRLPPPPDHAVRAVIGLNLDEAIRRLGGPDLSLDGLVELVSQYKTAFAHSRLQPDHDEPLYRGTLEFLHDLAAADILMAVATGKSMRGLKAVVERHGLHDFFVSLQTPDHNPGKPHPQMLEKAMHDAGAMPENTYMIGDTSYDMQLAKNAGCHAVGVGWGYHSKGELAAHGADHFVEDYDQFRKILDL